MLSGIVVLSFVILLMALVLRKLRQPYFIAYILAGIVLGPEVLGVIQQPETVEQLGELGVILLMFFIGAEINLPDLTKKFSKPLLGTLSQLILSFGFMSLLGYYLNWTWSIILLFSFVISLSSSAIIFQYLTKTGQIQNQLGLLTSGVLIIQDLLIVPMLISLSFLDDGYVNDLAIIKAVIGGILILTFLRAAIIKRLFKIPFKNELIKDHEFQIFIGFTLCFGMAWITHWFGLSSALGAFVAGILIGQDKATQWLDHSLVPFRVFFLAFFFLSVGLQIELGFLYKNAGTITLITLSVLLINSLINTLIFRVMGSSWRDSVYAGALLSQIGEFSFALVNVAIGIGLIGVYSYQITLAVIALTMMLSSIWISIIQQFIYRLPKTISLHKKSLYEFNENK